MIKIIVRYLLVFSSVLTMAVACSSPFNNTPKDVGGVYRSTNFGVDWEALDRSVLEATEDEKKAQEKKTELADSGVTFIEFSPENKNRIYAGTVSKGLFYSEDGGDRWKNILTSFIPHYLAVDPIDQDHIFVAGKSAGRARVLESKDRGKAWSEIFQDSQEGNSIRGLVINPANPNVLVVAMLSGHVLRSTDGGGAWNVVTRVADNLKRAVWPSQGPLFLLGEKKGIFVSKDAGLSFSSITDVLSDKKLWQQYFKIENLKALAKDKPVDLPPNTVAQFNAFSVSNSPTGPIFVATDVGLFVSYNQGLDWRFLKLPLRQNSRSGIHAVGHSEKAGQVYASVGNVIYYSDNDGEGWQVQGIATQGIINYILVDPEFPQVVFAGVVAESYD